MQAPALTPEQLSLLRGADTPTICNIIELFEIRDRAVGYMDSRIRCQYTEKESMVGYATTATFRASFKPDGGGPDAHTEQIKQMHTIPSPRVVVFQDLDDPSVGATFGDLMVSSFKHFGCVGLVTSGLGRDLQEISKMDFQLFTAGTVASHGWVQIGHVNQPVRVGGLVVRPGDLLHGDWNGVTVIPVEIAAAVAELVEGFVATEQILRSATAPGMPPDVEKWMAARGEMKAAQAKLREQAKARLAEVQAAK